MIPPPLYDAALCETHSASLPTYVGRRSPLADFFKEVGG